MANVDSPFGLKPVRYLSGAPYNGAVNAFHFASGNGTATFIGDPLIAAGTASTYLGEIRPDVAQAATGGLMIGVMVAVGSETADALKHRAASTARRAYVATDPDLVFEIQEVSGGTALTADQIGLNADFVVGTGSTVTGLSGVELNNGTEATTVTLDLKIVGFVNRPDNEVGEHCKWLVRINRHLYVNQGVAVT